MTQEYRDYLDSPEWKEKRLNAMTVSGNRCEACGSAQEMQVHHLTYARIFKEPLEDLMPLCRRCHEGIEEHIKIGNISRAGIPLELRKKTVLLLRDGMVAVPLPNLSEPKRIQSHMAATPEIAQAVARLDRHQFKKFVKKRYKNDRNKASLMANALIVYKKLRGNGEMTQVQSAQPSMVKDFPKALHALVCESKQRVGTRNLILALAREIESLML
jgi:hypothetical protein